MSPQRTSIIRSAVRYFLSAALLALTPKCFLCIATYAGIGVALGLGGQEICGATGRAGGMWISWLPGTCVALGLTGIFALRWCRQLPADRKKSPASPAGLVDNAAAETLQFP